MIARATVAATIAPVEPILDDLQLDAWRALLNAHAAMTERVDQALAAAGLRPLAWYDVLWALYRSPEQRLRMSQLADQTVITRSGLTRLVDRMEAAGVVERAPTRDDRRGAYAVITDHGRDLLRRMWPVYGGVVREHFAARLGEGELRVVRDALGRI
jgi:DNA-binding MarR family transcriptional regulator